jgi:hypothetical protein
LRKENGDKDDRDGIKPEIENMLRTKSVESFLDTALEAEISPEESVCKAGKEILSDAFETEKTLKDSPVDLFEKAIDEYGKIREEVIFSHEYVDVYRSWGEIHSLLGRLFRYKYLCILLELKKIKGDGETVDAHKYKKMLEVLMTSVKEARRHFTEAIKRLEQAKELDDEICTRSGKKSTERWVILGAAHYRLSLLYRCLGGEKFTLKADEERKKAENVFEKSKSTILSILVIFSEDICLSAVEEGVLRKLLDNKENLDAVFFNDVVDRVKKDSADYVAAIATEYKDVYIRSMYIISRLEVKSENGKVVAHYARKNVAERLLFGSSNFNLYAADYFNDPEEGEILLDYLYGERWKEEKEKKIKDRKKEFKTADMMKCEELLEAERSEYVTFAGSFSFDYDSLNQFRLYGKEEDKEGTGLALVFSRTFFRAELKQDRATFLKDIGKENDVKKEIDSQQDSGGWKGFEKRVKTARAKQRQNILFRCAYFDPTTKRVVTVGQKERYLFYRDKNDDRMADTGACDDKYKEYKEFIDKIIIDVNNGLTELKKFTVSLDPEVVAQLTLKLRYLIKHVAFREEQECRIVKNCKLVGDTTEKVCVGAGGQCLADDYKLHLEYDLKVSQHVEKIYFGPKAGGLDVFRKCLVNKDMEEIRCEQSKTRLA